MPKLIGEDNWFVKTLGARFITFIGDEVDVCNVCGFSRVNEDVRWQTHVQLWEGAA